MERRLTYLFEELKILTGSTHQIAKNREAISSVVDELNDSMDNSLERRPIQLSQNPYDHKKEGEVVDCSEGEFGIAKLDFGAAERIELALDKSPFSNEDSCKIVVDHETYYGDLKPLSRRMSHDYLPEPPAAKALESVIVNTSGSVHSFHRAIDSWLRFVESGANPTEDSREYVDNPPNELGSTNDARDKWLRDTKAENELTLKAIATKLRHEHPEWEHLEPGSINSAINRFESRKGLPALPKRKGTKKRGR